MKRKLNDKDVGLMITELLRTGIFRITPPTEYVIDQETGLKAYIQPYGSGDNSGKIIITSKYDSKYLRAYDLDVMLIIENLTRTNNGEFSGHITDLLRMKGMNNCWDRKSINYMWDAAERLIHTTINITPNKRGGSISMSFKPVTGYIESDGTVFFVMEDYKRIVRQFNLYEFRIPLSQYFSYKNSITKKLRYFLSSQRDQKYQISLFKLCSYIGYTPKGYGWWYIWSKIKPSIEELIEDGFLSKPSNRRNTKRMKDEGGVITFYKSKKEVEENKPANKSSFTRKPMCPIGKVYGVDYSNRVGCVGDYDHDRCRYVDQCKALSLARKKSE